MVTKTTVGIIIVNWNGTQDTLACLGAVAKLEHPGITVNVYVVDNHSEGDATGKIQKKFPQVVVIGLSDNLGFTGGNNVGIERALGDRCDFVWLLNNDTVVDPKALVALLAAFHDPKVGIAGSKIYFAPGHEYHANRYSPKERGHVFWYAGGIIDWNNVYLSHRGVDEVDHGQYDEKRETQFITGCSMFIQRSVFEAVGKLDERYFLYFEDADFCLRAKKHGFSLLYVPQSVVWHINAGSSDRPGNPLHQYYMTRNRLLFGFSYASTRTKLAILRESLRFFLTGKPEQKQAVKDVLLGKWGKQYLWKTNQH